MPIASVVIPAHDERRVIGRCLQALTDHAEPGELEIVVVCNGCTDDTAEVARAWPAVSVVEIATASKIAALNAGDRHVSTFPRFYVDADVELGTDALRATAEVLASGPILCAAPRPRFELAGRPWAIRLFYDTWSRLPYLTDEVVGNGVYALSAAGRERFDEFPELIADDGFVMERFARGERRALPDCSFTVYPPLDGRGLVRIRTRVYRGNAELAASAYTPASSPGPAAPAMGRLVRDPRRLPGVVVYAGINAWAKLRARRVGPGWERDDSARDNTAPTVRVVPAGEDGE